MLQTHVAAPLVALCEFGLHLQPAKPHAEAKDYVLSGQHAGQTRNLLREMPLTRDFPQMRTLDGGTDAVWRQKAARA